MEVKEIVVEAVRVTGRHRKDVGDVAALAESIRTRGLMNAITVTEDGTLVAGQRRLEAFRLLGRDVIPAHMVYGLTDAAERLRMERDENTERKPMTPEELVSLGRALEALERPKARERMLAGQPSGGNSGGLGDTRDVVGKALGWSGFTYDRAKAVVDAANDTEAPPEQRAVAREALAEMNATGKVLPSFEKVRQQRDTRLGTRQRSTIGDAKKQRFAITKAAHALSGIAMGFSQIDAIHPDITSEEAAQWVDDLSEARRAIEVLIKRLKELSSA